MSTKQTTLEKLQLLADALDLLAQIESPICISPEEAGVKTAQELDELVLKAEQAIRAVRWKIINNT